MSAWPEFTGGTYQSQSSVIAGERCINFYPAPIDGPGKTARALYPTPGLTAGPGSIWGWNLNLSNTGDTSITGLFSQDGRAFATTNLHAFELTEGVANPPPLGSIASNAAQSSMASNGVGGHQLAIASGRSLYIFDLLSGAFSGPILDTSSDPVAADVVLFLDGYFIALNVAAQTFQISALFDGLTWDPADVAQSTASSDKWVSMSKSDRTLWLIGSQTAQPWYNNGNADFPFAPFEGAFVETGCAAVGSVVRFGQEDSGPIYLSTSESGGYSFRHLNGYTPQRISTEGVEWMLSQYDDVSDAVAYSYSDQGQNFYVCVLPSAKAGWAWSPTGGWHERLEWCDVLGLPLGEWDAPHTWSHCFCFGQHLVGYRKLAIVSASSVTSVFGPNTIIRRVRQTPVLSREGSVVKIPRITVDVEPGLGIAEDFLNTQFAMQATTVSLQLSRDGGKTWGNERTCSAGALGDYGKRIYWDMNGQGRNVVARVVVSDPAHWRISNAYLGRP